MRRSLHRPGSSCARYEGLSFHDALRGNALIFDLLMREQGICQQFAQDGGRNRKVSEDGHG